MGPWVRPRPEESDGPAKPGHQLSASTKVSCPIPSGTSPRSLEVARVIVVADMNR